MTAINLLPTDLSPRSSTVKVADTAKKIAIAIFALIVVFAIAAIIFFMTISVQIRNLSGKNEQLRASVSSLEETEQRLVLIRDRLKKVEAVQAKDTTSIQLEPLKEILPNFPPTVTLRELSVFSRETEMSFTINSSPDLARVLANIMAGDYYKRIELSSFSFNPSSGYFISLKLYME